MLKTGSTYYTGPFGGAGQLDGRPGRLIGPGCRSGKERAMYVGALQIFTGDYRVYTGIFEYRVLLQG